jgi:hypothetical protein
MDIDKGELDDANRLGKHLLVGDERFVTAFDGRGGPRRWRRLEGK